MTTTNKTNWMRCDDCDPAGNGDELGHGRLTCVDCGERLCETLMIKARDVPTYGGYRCEDCDYKWRRGDERARLEDAAEFAADQRYDEWKDRQLTGEGQ